MKKQNLVRFNITAPLFLFSSGGKKNAVPREMKIPLLSACHFSHILLPLQYYFKFITAPNKERLKLQ